MSNKIVMRYLIKLMEARNRIVGVGAGEKGKQGDAN